MGWFALALLLASVIVAKSYGDRTSGPMTLAGLAGFMLGIWVTTWWLASPAEQVAPTPAPTEVVQVAPAPGQAPGQVADLAPPAGEQAPGVGAVG